MMREIGAFEAKTLRDMLIVAEGEEIVIARRGKPVPRLIRDNGFDREKASRAAAAILAATRGITLALHSQDERTPALERLLERVSPAVALIRPAAYRELAPRKRLPLATLARALTRAAEQDSVRLLLRS